MNIGPLRRLGSRLRAALRGQELRSEPEPQPRKTKVHLCHLVSDLDLGEAPNEVRHISNNLDTDAYMVSCLCLHERGRTAFRVEPRVQVFALHRSPGATPQLCAEVAGELREYRVDLLHCHGEEAHLVGQSAAVLAGIQPIIYSEYKFPKIQSEQIKQNMPRRNWLTRRWVASTAQVADALTQAHGLARTSVVRIPRQVDTEVFRRSEDRTASQTELGLRPRSTVLGTLLSTKTGGRTASLLRAAALLVDAGHDVQVLVAGQGPEEDDLRRLGDALTLGARLTFSGRPGDIPALLAAMDIYVHPAADEGCSLTALEAMSCGLAVVAPREGAAAELVDDGKTGVLFTPGKDRPDALAKALIPLLSDAALRHTLGAQARDRIVEHHAIESVMPRYVRLYEELSRNAEAPSVRVAQGG